MPKTTSAKRSRSDDIASPAAAAATSLASPPAGAGNRKKTAIKPGTQQSKRFKQQQQHELTNHERRCISLYQQYMEIINKRMVEWAQDGLQKIESGEYNSSNPPLLLDFSYEYLRKIEFYEKRYKMPMGMDVYSFGSNDCFQIDTVEGTVTSSPLKSQNLVGRNIVQVSAGGLHNAAVTKIGTVYTWGCNDEGQLGKITNSDVEQMVPSQVKGFNPSSHALACHMEPRTTDRCEDNSMIKVSTGDCHTLTLSITGNVYEMGCYKDSEGKPHRIQRPPDDTTVDPPRGEDDDGNENTVMVDIGLKGRHFQPTHVYLLSRKVIDIDCGASFNAAILDDGTLVTWGVGVTGEMARSDDMTTSMKKEKDSDQNDYMAHDLAGLLEKYRKLEPDEDKLKDLFMTPKPVRWDIPPPISTKRKVLTVACGSYHLLVIARDNNSIDETLVYASGLNNYGQLGLGDTQNRPSLTVIESLRDKNISKISAGLQFSVAVDCTGHHLYGWGRSDYGQLGITDEIPSAGDFKTTPQLIKFPNDNDDEIVIKEISCGDTHTIVSTQDGQSVYTFGYGDVGSLGHGEEEDEPRPRKLKQVSVCDDDHNEEGGGKKGLPACEVRQVSGGGQHTLILMTPL